MLKVDLPDICDQCHHTLIKLQDRSGLSISWFCNNCKVEYDPEAELRSKSKLSMSEGPIEEPAVTALAIPDGTAFYNKKKPVYHGGVKTLAEKGLKIVNYSDIY